MDWSESSKDLLIAFTAETEEWATYLQTVLKGTVKENSIFFYCLGTLQLQQADALCLSAYKCKLLIASKGLMKRLTEIMRFHLARILHPPESVVIFLCGIESTDKLYSLVPIEKRCWELSCDQDPQEFVQLICSVIQQGRTEGSEVTTSDETQLKPDNEDIFLPSGDSNSPVLVIPKRLQCENPGEIFILIRDQGIEAHMMEVEFSSNKEQIRIQPSVWSDQVLYMKALDFAAGMVNVKVYSEGIMKYTTDIEYYTAMGEIVRLLNKVTDPIAFMCQALQISSKEKLDELLTFSLKSKMEPGGYDFSENDKSDYRRDNLHSGDLPTLLHFAAKYGLTQLVSLLMKCPGAVQASQITNKRGENPINLASSYGYNDVKKLLEELSVSEVSPDKEDQSVPFTGKAQVSSPQAETSKYSQDEEDDVYIIMTENPPKFLQEGEKNLKQEGKKTEIPDIEEIEREQDEMVEEEEEEDPYSIADSDDVYDMILSSDVKRKSSFIPNRPPAPTPRPPPATPVGIKEVNTPYIAQVFQQKSTHPQAGIDKLYTAVSKPGSASQDLVDGGKHTKKPDVPTHLSTIAAAEPVHCSTDAGKESVLQVQDASSTCSFADDLLQESPRASPLTHRQLQPLSGDEAVCSSDNEPQEACIQQTLRAGFDTLEAQIANNYEQSQIISDTLSEVNASLRHLTNELYIYNQRSQENAEAIRKLQSMLIEMFGPMKEKLTALQNADSSTAVTLLPPEVTANAIPDEQDTDFASYQDESLKKQVSNTGTLEVNFTEADN